MIELLHDPSSEASRRVVDRLERLTVAHAVTSDRAGFPADAVAPAIREGDLVVSGAEAIDAYLKDLASYMAEWSRFQGDTCYIGDDACII